MYLPNNLSEVCRFFFSFLNSSSLNINFLSLILSLKEKSCSYCHFLLKLKAYEEQAIVFSFVDALTCIMTNNLQCTGDMDIRDEKPLTDALSTLFHVVCVPRICARDKLQTLDQKSPGALRLFTFTPKCSGEPGPGSQLQLCCAGSKGCAAEWTSLSDWLCCLPSAQESITGHSESLLAYCPKIISFT